jgi:hypothetical protein
MRRNSPFIGWASPRTRRACSAPVTGSLPASSRPTRASNDAWSE